MRCFSDLRGISEARIARLADHEAVEDQVGDRCCGRLIVGTQKLAEINDLNK
jgi:hypothetical protein